MPKLILLTTEPTNFVPVELEKSAKAAGWDVEIINPDECALNVSDTPQLFNKGEVVEKADACIPRMSEENLEYKAAIMDYLSASGVRLLNSSESMSLASNKLSTQILLNANEIKTPSSAMIAHVDQLEAAHTSIGGKYPVVLKTLSGTHGVGVMRVDSAASMMSVAQTLEKMNAQYMLQEYIEHDASRRILMLNGEVIACVSRSVPKDDFRTNAHQGAELTLVKDVDQKEIDVCKKVCELIGTKLGAVDYIVDGDNIIVLELNGSPGWESMQKVVDDKNIAELVVAAYELTGDSDIPVDDVKVDPATVSGELVAPDAETADAPKEEDVSLAKDGDTVDYENPEDEKDISTPVDLSPTNTAKIMVGDKEIDAVIIGAVQSFTIKRFNDEKPIEARVDTGATGSSLAGDDVEISDSIIAFTFNGTRYRCHATRTADIKSASGTNQRPIVKFDIEINGVILNNVDFSITSREDMKFDALLGRNTLAAAGVLINPALGEIPVDAPSKNDAEKTEESVNEGVIEDVSEVILDVIQKVETLFDAKEVVDTVVDAKIEESFDKFGSSAKGAETFNYKEGNQVTWEYEGQLANGIVESVGAKTLIVRTNAKSQTYIQKTNVIKVIS